VAEIYSKEMGAIIMLVICISRAQKENKETMSLEKLWNTALVQMLQEAVCAILKQQIENSIQ